MNIITLLIYIISSIILNIILTKLEQKKKDNLIDYIIISNIYMLILSGIFESYNITKNNDNIFIIIVFLILGKVFYLSLIKERTILKNNDYHLKKYILTLISSYLINLLIINKVDSILPSMETIKLILWLFVSIYIYNYIKKNIDIKVPIDNNVLFYQDKEYIVMQHAKYKNKYHYLVDSKYQDINLLLYAMMIYENYNKPEQVRKLDNFKYKLFHRENKFGIMQIEAKEPITDEESIDIVRKKLEKLYPTSSKGKDNVKVLIKKYYQEDKIEVEEIYKIIKGFV